jgi:hypothetical protein
LRKKKVKEQNALEWITERIENLKHPMEKRGMCECGKNEPKIVTDTYEYCRCGGIIRTFKKEEV